MTFALRCLALLTLALPCAAAAQRDDSPQLAWRAPAGCPDAAQVRRTVAHWLSRSAEPVDASALTVQADAMHDAQGYSALLTLASPSGRSEHRLAADSCETLVDVLALKVALAASALSPPAPVTRPPSRLPLAAAEPTHPSVLHGSVRAAGGAVIGRFPRPSSTLSLAGALMADWARFELAASYVPVQVVRFAAPAEVGAEVQLLTLGVRACATTPLHWAQVLGCLGVELGSMRATGFGTASSATWDRLFAEVAFGPALRAPLGSSLFVWLELDGALVFVRPSYSVRNLGELYRPAMPGGRIFFGLELQI